MTIEDERTAVYRIYNLHDDLLYIGATKNLEQRFAGHARTARWWPEVARHEADWYDVRVEAFVVEAALIHELKPRYNVQSPSPKDIKGRTGNANGGRPPTGEMPIQHTRIDDDDWADLEAIYGRRRAQIVRDLIRYQLRRPGARLPDRPSREEVDEVARKRIARKAAE